MEAVKKRPPLAAARAAACFTLLLVAWSLYKPTNFLVLTLTPDPAAGAPLSTGPGGLIPLRQAVAQRRQCPPLPRSGSTASIAFLHVPKTAGTFLTECMRLMLPSNGTGRWCTRGPNADLPASYVHCGRRQDGWDDPKPDQLKLLEAVKHSFPSRCGGFSNHHDINFFHLAGIDFARTLTVVALRHPVERQISQYYFHMLINPDMMRQANYWPASEGDTAGLLKYVREHDSSANHQVRQLAGAFGCRWPDGPTTRPEGRAILEEAKRNLERFCVIVIDERIEESLSGLGAAAGWNVSKLLGVAAQLGKTGKLLRGGKVNGNPHPPVSLEVRQVIERESWLDMQLYEHALRVFEARNSR